MKFVDEAKICVEAGTGGHGACSFLRLKFMPFGGPDGGNGGEGGSVFLRADERVNTLIDYRYVQTYRAQNGEGGSGRHCTGKSGEDLILSVPVGTIVYDDHTGECIADLARAEQLACVAQGGQHGIGNARFKSSINRTPRRTIPGQPGEMRYLRLELRVLADVGLVGLPNAGKSTLMRAMSAARPKVADYPFTTLHPHLGVVKATPFRSFVMADLPGLIAGAAEGVGLGVRFLKHVTRTRLLFHVVDVAHDQEPVEQVQVITKELALFHHDLPMKERWLILNKVDLLSPDTSEQHCDEIIHHLGWTGKTFIVSGLARQGLDHLIQQTMHYLEE